MKKVCIDTNILGWAIKGYASAGDEENIVKANKLIAFLNEEKITIIIPSIVVAELMADVIDDDERERICDYISKNFFVAQYDIITARIFAGIRVKKKKETKDLEVYRNENNIPKCKMLNDWNICSIALTKGCDTIFTNNAKDFRKFSGDLIQIESLEFVDKIIAQRKAEVEIQKKISEAQERNSSGGQVKLFPSDLDKILEENDYDEEE